MVPRLIRLIKWGYYLFCAWRYTRRSDKFSDLYFKTHEVTALDVSETYLKTAETYIKLAERMFK